MNTKLVCAVIREIGFDPDEINDELLNTLGDIANRGIDGGFPGFTYYADTLNFFRANKREIVELCHEMAEDSSLDVISFVVGFKCVDDDRESRDEIGRAIYGTPEPADYLVQNALAWFAAEEVASFLTQ